MYQTDKTEFEYYIADRGVRDYMAEFSSPEDAAQWLYDYIVGQAADDTDAYDPEGADEMRQTEYADVLAWVNSNWPN